MTTVKIATVEFYTDDLKNKIKNGYCFLETGRDVYYLSELNGIIKACRIFHAKRDAYPLPLTKKGRFYLKKQCDYL